MSKDDFNARAYSRLRIPVVNAQMRDVAPGFILFAGDSHIDLYRQPSKLCDRDTINAGVSGANAAVYTAAIKKLKLPSKAAAAVLVIGTNDLLRKATVDSINYERKIETLLDALKVKAEFVFATAIPPVAEEKATDFDVGGIETYSKVIARVCGRLEKCSFHDPYEGLRREGTFGIAKNGVTIDGVHARSYREIYEQLPLCDVIPRTR
ncbi:SGNH/GDSL hydrolase family protein [Microvirga zambiensis]|uniref:SGNH/GDSL hydrolase family protein n=1 Tax=Microvirga zambiensis TaxID=1402137 RepID=UPI00191E4A3A|nr:SGNH/GDSL hydrolase family protein [Microvirga zambiensis]